MSTHTCHYCGQTATVANYHEGAADCAAESLRQVAKESRKRASINLGSEYNGEELAFMRAMDAYKREHQRPFPTWREVLAVLKSLGYEKQLSRNP